MDEISVRWDYPGAALLERMEQVERQGQEFQRISAEVRREPTRQKAAAYVQALASLRTELESLQHELGIGSSKGMSQFWHELTEVVTGEEQFVP